MNAWTLAQYERRVRVLRRSVRRPIGAPLVGLALAVIVAGICLVLRYS